MSGQVHSIHGGALPYHVSAEIAVVGTSEGWVVTVSLGAFIAYKSMPIADREAAELRARRIGAEAAKLAVNLTDTADQSLADTEQK
jgi:hypothetical protein